MNVVFLSNYFNHHQKPLSDALASRSKYTFLSTAEMTAERKKLGWGTETEPEYVCHADRKRDYAMQCLQKADVVIAGSAPEEWVQQAIRQGKTVFRYSERPLKNGLEPAKYLLRWIRWHRRNPRKKPIYLLCAGSFVAEDYGRFGLFRGKAYRWGYFPEVRRHDDLQAKIAQKTQHSIVWAGRFLSWKHPDMVVHVAARLKAEGIPFQAHLIGTGPMETQLREMIEAAHLQEFVHMPGSMKPEEVRSYMENAEIFLFTSDRQEGWGAVLNEAMNSGCAVVASDAAGATAYLINNGKNGIVYPSEDLEQLYTHTKALLQDRQTAQRMGMAAYDTIISQWNAETAAERLVELAKRLNSQHSDVSWDAGPCSLDRGR